MGLKDRLIEARRLSVAAFALLAVLVAACQSQSLDRASEPACGRDRQQGLAGHVLGATWAGLRIVVTRAEPEEGLQLVDAAGALRESITDHRIQSVRIQDLTGDGELELWVTSWSGGAHCCFTEHILGVGAQGPTHLLALDAGDGSVGSVQDLDGDGHPELIVDLPTFVETAPDEGESFWRVLVLSWDGNAFRDVTGRHPNLSRLRVQEEREIILDPRITDTRRNALALLGNALLAGRGEAERAWLARHYGEGAQELVWLRAFEGPLESALSATDALIRRAPARLAE